MTHNGRNTSSTRNRYGAKTWVSARYPFRSGATTFATLTTRTPSARHDAQSGEQTTDHGSRTGSRVPDMSVDSGGAPVSRQADRDDAGRRILPCMSDKHQVEAIGPVEVDTQADPGGDPLVPAPDTRLSGIALGYRRRRHGCQGRLGRPGHGRTRRPPHPGANASAVDAGGGQRDHRVRGHQGAAGPRHDRRAAQSAVACRASSRMDGWRAPRTSIPAGSAGRRRTTSVRPSVDRCSSSMTRTRLAWPSWPMVPPRAGWARSCC